VLWYKAYLLDILNRFGRDSRVWGTDRRTNG